MILIINIVLINLARDSSEAGVREERFTFDSEKV